MTHLISSGSGRLKSAWVDWDPYDVCRRLVRKNPSCDKNAASNTGRLYVSMAREFWATVAEYPEPLQDALCVIARTEGFDAALAALDGAISEHRKKESAKQPADTKRPG
jgi:hypothetical protein